MQAAKLDRKGKFYEKVVVQNSFGEPVVGYRLFHSCYAGKETVNTQNKEAFEASMLTGRDLVYFLIRYKAGITRTMVFACEGLQYDVHTVTEVGRRESQRILMEELDQKLTLP